MNLTNIYITFLTVICLSNLSAQTQYAKIVVYRNEKVFEKIEEDFKIFADDNLTTSLKNFHFEEFYMPEGSFKLKVNDIYPTVLKVDCNLNQTYYFRINRNFSLQDKPVTIVAVDSITATNELKYLKSYFAIKPKIVNNNRRNGIGVFIEPGVGFERIPLISSIVGTSVMHSFGGGAAFGLSYNYKFSNYIGCSAQLLKQYSILSPAVSNASVTFDQSILSATPYFAIPVIKKYKQNIRIGGGLDYHFGNVLNIETEKLNNGFNDTWTYSNKFGYHIITFYEWMMNSRMLIHAGFKYNDIRYSYVYSEKYYPLNPQLSTPRGNALSFSFGFEYFI